MSGAIVAGSVSAAGDFAVRYAELDANRNRWQIIESSGLIRAPGIGAMAQAHASPVAIELRRFGLFKTLADDELGRISGGLHIRNWAKGEMVVRHLDASCDVFLLIEGQLLANQFSAAGREISYRRIFEGSYFGELAAIDGLPRSVNIVAMSDARIASIGGAAFRAMLETSPALMRALIADMASRIRDLSNRLFESSAVTVPCRVDAELIRLALASGVAGNRATIAAPPTHAELAALIGGQREAVTREFGKLLAAGLIAKTGRTLTVLDIEGLIERVENGGGDAPG